MNIKNEISLATLQTATIEDYFENARGPLPFTMTNDAIFHMVFEANPIALKGLLCSLLRMRPEKIVSVEVKNPLQFNQDISKKKFILDLRIMMNDNYMINIEMQVERLRFWKDRSIVYLCRAFDNLNVGDSYEDILPAIHIGILDFDLFPDNPEFFATYHIANDKNNQIYSDNFCMSVLNLRQIDCATDEDIYWGLDKWAKLFKAKTWEEVHMIAKEETSLYEAARTLYRITTNEQTRYWAESLFEGERTVNTLLKDREKDRALLAEKDAELSEKNAELSEKDAEIMRLRGELEKMRNTR